MNAFDWIELLAGLALLGAAVVIPPWTWLLKRYPRQLEPFEYFAYAGSMPRRWLVIEYYAGKPIDATAGKGWHFNYSDGQREFVSVARVRL